MVWPPGAVSVMVGLATRRLGRASRRRAACYCVVVLRCVTHTPPLIPHPLSLSFSLSLSLSLARARARARDRDRARDD